jgi:predicted Zn-dependent peptidase
LLLPDAAMLVGLFLVLAVLLGCPTVQQAVAAEYDPSSIYDVERFRLRNDFDVILKRRTHAHNVAVRLVVGVGFRHFPCEMKETPHFLEHLLFMGTSKHSEATLARRIQDHGGAWNGFTGPSETFYQIDVYDKHLPLAIDTLHEMMTDTVITPQTIESARAIIHRERSGVQSKLFRWLYANGISKPADAKAAELLVPGVVCPGLVTPDGIGEADVRETYKNYYVPSNMTLIVVGNFDRDALASQLRSTFGKMEPRAGNGIKLVTPPYLKIGTAEVTGTLSPLLGSDGYVGVVYRTDGSDSPDYYALTVLGRYLKRVLYEKIRVEKALSYSPSSGYYGFKDYGAFIVVVDVNLDKVKLVKALIEEEIANLREGRIKAEDVQAAERSILMGFAQSYESNSSLAGLYVQVLDQLKASPKTSSRASATPADLQRVAKKHLREESRVVIRSTPTLTYTQFYVGLGLSLVAVPGTGFYLLRRFIKRRRKD